MTAIRSSAASILLLIGLAVAPAWAGEADVVAVVVDHRMDGRFDFHVTIRSNDRGWDSYADAFEILTPDGGVLGRRELLHPHADEQPFTRELLGVAVPPGIEQVVVRAHHRRHGYDDTTVTIPLPR